MPKEAHPSNVYDAIQQSSLPPQDKTVKRMSEEIRVLIAAGGDTVARMLNYATFHLLDNSETLARLRTEILQVMPEVHSMPSVNTLKELPLLVSAKAPFAEANANSPSLLTPVRPQSSKRRCASPAS